MIPSTLRLAERLDKHLGDPFEKDRPLSFASSVARDEAEAYPDEALKVLDDWGLNDYYVPAASGGALRNYETVQALVRMVARRDVTTAVAHANTYLGCSPVWLAGTAMQRARAAGLAQRGQRVSLALTEETHGSDLVASDVVARSCAKGWRLHGEKWAISNATRGNAVTVLARTDPSHGPRGLSLFLVEKAGLPKDAVANTRRLKTHGVRGADISGIRFNQTPLSIEDLIGEPGEGLDIVLKSLQISRGLVGGVSLGAADTALRSTLAFSRSRHLYGDTLVRIPHVRTVLTKAFVDLLICDCVSMAVCRMLHFYPETMASASSVAKSCVPTTVEKITRSLAVVLGARHYLREGHWRGIFEKILRDVSLVSLFDGSTVVNLSALGAQLRLWVERRGMPEPTELDRAFEFACEPPPFAPDRLALVHVGRHDVVESLGSWAERAIAEATVEADVQRCLESSRETLAEELERLVADTRAAATRPAAGFARSSELFALTRRYCALYAAAACLLVWRANCRRDPAFIGGGEWLVFALGRIMALLGRSPGVAAAVEDRVWSHLMSLYEERRLFSIVPLQLSFAGASDGS